LIPRAFALALMRDLETTEPGGAGEHRLPACSFRQLAENLFDRFIPRAVAMLGASSAGCRRQQAGSLRSPEL